MRRKRSNTSASVAALILLTLCSIVLFTVYEKEGQSGPLHTVQLGAAEVLRPAQSVVEFVANPLGAIKQGASDIFNGNEEERLRQQARENEEAAAQAARLKEENQRLRQLLGGEQASYEYAPLAQVISPIGRQFAERVVINVGTEDGVEPQQPVVVGDSMLIGRTTSRVTANTAEVMLITDQSFTAGARTVHPAEGQQGSPSPEELQNFTPGGEGLLRMSTEDYLALDYVDLGADVEKGDYVVTSGRSGNRELLFPPGLLIGTVKSVSSQDIDQFKKIVVDPAVDPQKVEEVRVITGW